MATRYWNGVFLILISHIIARSKVPRSYNCEGMATAVSAGLERLVAERIASEAKLLRVEFALCFATILFGLAGASLLWRSLRDSRNRARRRAYRRRAAREDASTRTSTRTAVCCFPGRSVAVSRCRWDRSATWLYAGRVRATRRFRLTAVGMQIDAPEAAHSPEVSRRLARSSGSSEQSLREEELAADDHDVQPRSARGFDMAHEHGQIDSVLIPRSQLLGITGSSDMLGVAPPCTRVLHQLHQLQGQKQTMAMKRNSGDRHAVLTLPDLPDSQTENNPDRVVPQDPFPRYSTTATRPQVRDNHPGETNGDQQAPTAARADAVSSRDRPRAVRPRATGP